MKNVLLIIFLVFASCTNRKEVYKNAEISCGQCQFNLEGEGCSLAVRYNNNAYYVEGFGIDDFGDAHNKETGFCEVIRTGEITGFVKDEKFIASNIILNKK